MRNYKIEVEERVECIRKILEKSGASGIVFGNSGGKDSALVGILCKMACDNTVGILLPCFTKRNYEEDMIDAKSVAKFASIETRIVDLSPVRDKLVLALDPITRLDKLSLANIAPRLRMTTLYAIASAENRLVAGTGNKSEEYVGYFTKWGDGAHDFNVIADLTATEVFEFLNYLKAPESIISKAPSAALFDGQTDEEEMGVTYSELDSYIDGLPLEKSKEEKIIKLNKSSEHKRKGVVKFPLHF